MTRYFLILVLSITLMFSCRQGSDWETLARAEAMMVTEPEAAHDILDSLAATGRSAEFSACLKLAKADCEYYSDVLAAKNDSAISEAIEYFKEHGNNKRLARAYFLRANQRADGGEFGRAIVDYLNAEEWATKANDSVSLGLIYRGMSESYQTMEDMGSALAYMQKSYDIFNAISSNKYMYWTAFDYARSLSNALHFEEALCIILNCVEKTNTLEDNILHNECLCLTGCIYNYLNNFDKAEEYFEKCEEFENSAPNKHYWMNFGRSLVELGRIDEAQAMQDSLTKYFPDEYYLKLLIANKRNDKDAIIACQQKLLTEQDDAFKTLYRREFANIVDSYYKEQQAAANAREQRNRVALTAAILVVILLAAVLWIDVRRRRAERRNSQAALQLLEENLRVRENEHHALEESSQHRIEDMRSQLRELLRERIAAAERMTRDLEDAPASKREQKIYCHLREALTEFAPDSPYLQSVEATLNQMLDGLLADFRSDYPEAKESDVAMLIYQVLKVPSAVCAAVMDVTPATVYSKRSRLRTRIQARPDVAGRYLPFLA